MGQRDNKSVSLKFSEVHAKMRAAQQETCQGVTVKVLNVLKLEYGATVTPVTLLLVP